VNVIQRIFSRGKGTGKQNQKPGNFCENTLDYADDFRDFSNNNNFDPYLVNAWVNIAVGILIRNIGRAAFAIYRGGECVGSGPLYDLFRRPNALTSGFDLWKETAAWWLIEGEAFWWFGSEYGGGLPHELYVLDPRRMRSEIASDEPYFDVCGRSNRRWFYQSDVAAVPLLPDELIHFREWNPWNPVRGVCPLVPLFLEVEQDYYAGRANSQLLKSGAIPQGVLKTEQAIRPEEADALERRWESKYALTGGKRKIAVLGKGTEFVPITFSPDVVKLFELKRWNVYTILGKYGIPPRVANINEKTTSLSGKDTVEQHAAFWKYTILPLLRQYENILETQFFRRFGLKERGAFDLTDIPELQKAEDEQSVRDIAEINAGLKTINEVLAERGKPPKPWGDTWYRPKSLIPIDTRDKD
jgi:HK97 family phage portal protein